MWVRGEARAVSFEGGKIPEGRSQEVRVVVIYKLFEPKYIRKQSVANAVEESPGVGRKVIVRITPYAAHEAW